MPPLTLPWPCYSMQASTSGRGGLLSVHRVVRKIQGAASAVPGALFRGLKKAVDASSADSWFVRAVIWLVRGPLRPALLAFYAKVGALRCPGRVLSCCARRPGSPCSMDAC